MKEAVLQSNKIKLPYILEYSYFLVEPGGLFSLKCLKQLFSGQLVYNLMVMNKEAH